MGQCPPILIITFWQRGDPRNARPARAKIWTCADARSIHQKSFFWKVLMMLTQRFTSFSVPSVLNIATACQLSRKGNVLLLASWKNKEGERSNRCSKRWLKGNFEILTHKQIKEHFSNTSFARCGEFARLRVARARFFLSDHPSAFWQW